ncbi:hypothetical protein ACHOLT_11910 [Desulfitobacterium sp. Sab5]|uniref:hypothetical protein n=1 Tax=Desulfitobacterium nosdiversum TaxID=3375356 RepID=UPI003CEECCCF
MESRKRLLPPFIGIITVIILSSAFYNNDNANSTNYLRIIDKVFSENSKYIRGAVVLWGKGDVPMINQLYTNYPIDSASCTFASKNGKLAEKYYLIMDVIGEIPKLDKVELRNLNIEDYYELGANIEWENKNNSKSIQKYYSVRVFVDRNNNIYLPEIYPYHDNNTNYRIEGNRFLMFLANDKTKGLLEKIF